MSTVVTYTSNPGTHNNVTISAAGQETRGLAGSGSYRSGADIAIRSFSLVKGSRHRYYIKKAGYGEK